MRKSPKPYSKRWFPTYMDRVERQPRLVTPATNVNIVTIRVSVSIVSLCFCQKLLCAYAFPQCIIQDGRTERLPLCYEDCIATSMQFCYNDWALVEDKKAKGIFFKSRGHFRLPNCKALPRYNRTAKPSVCTHVGLTKLDPEETTCKSRLTYMQLHVIRRSDIIMLSLVWYLQMIVVWATENSIWAMWMSRRRELRVRSGIYRCHTHIFSHRMFFHKHKMLRIIAVMPVAKSRIHGVIQWTSRFDGSGVMCHCVVSVFFSYGKCLKVTYYWCLLCFYPPQPIPRRYHRTTTQWRPLPWRLFSHHRWCSYWEGWACSPYWDWTS